MSRLSLNPKVVAVVVAALLVAALLLLVGKDEEKRTVTAHFPRAVSVFEGTDVRILDIFGNTASVRVDAGAWVDYLHIVKWNGRWVIINVLWELRQ